MVDLAKLLKDIDDDIELTEILGESPEFNLRCKVAIRELAAERDALKDALEVAKDKLNKAQELADWHQSHRAFAEAQLETARKQEPIGWVNIKYGTYYRPNQLATTSQNDELIASGELIRVYPSPVPAQQSAEVTPGIAEAAHEVTRALTALRHTRDAFEIGGLIRSDMNSICDVLDVTASKLFQIAKGGENER